MEAEQATSKDQARVKALRLREAVLLEHASARGNSQKDARLDALVQELRGEASLAFEERWVLLSNYECSRLRRGSAKGEAGALQLQEKAARALLAQFPQQRQPYELFLNCAKTHSDDAQAGRLAGELLGMKGVPITLKREARQVLERSALVGRRLWEVIPQAASFLPTQPVLPTGSPAGLVSPQELARKRLPQVIMYTWSKDDAYSLEAARRLVELVPRDCLVVGVNLDLDCPQARSLGGELPGRQYYDQRGLEGDIARRLFLEKGFTVLITGRRGQILTLRGARNMERLGAFLSQ